MSNIHGPSSTAQPASKDASVSNEHISVSQNEFDELDVASQPRGLKRSARSQGRISSCAECRRLKLKCDRGASDSWPCVQCRRRKCSELCPGSTSTPTAKAGNEKLLRHYRNKIADLEARLSAASAPPPFTQPESHHTDSAHLNSRSEQPGSSFSPVFSSAHGEGIRLEQRQQDEEAGEMQPPAASPQHQAGYMTARPPNSYVADNTQMQRPAPQGVDDASDKSYEPADQMYWPDDLSDPASPIALPADASPPVSMSAPGPALPSTLNNEMAAQTSVPSGPTFFGRSAGALYRQADKGNVSKSRTSPSQRLNFDLTDGIRLTQFSVLALSIQLFDTSPMICSPYLQQSALSVLPPTLWQALEILDKYNSQVAWMYTPVDVTYLQRSLQQLYSGSTNVMTEPRLSMVLLALALGALFDEEQNNPKSPFSSVPDQRRQGNLRTTARTIASDRPWSASVAPHQAHSRDSQSQRIFQLGFQTFLRQTSALSVFAPCVWESAVCAHLAVSYLLSRGQADTSHAAWQVLGSGIRIAVSLGLHCSQSRWNLPPEQTSAHARVWWELQAYERLQSLNFGRPSCLPEHISCRHPFQITGSDWQTLQPNKEVFHAIKYQLGPLYAKINLLHCKEETPSVLHVMSIDAEIRSFMRNIPSWLRLDEESPPSGQAVTKDASSSSLPGPHQISQADCDHILPQKHMLSLLFHKAILFLHRPFFCKATKNTNEPLLSPYASSFAAAIGSARQHTMLFSSAMDSCPSALKWWFFIFHLYTAAVLQAQVLLRCPRSMLATEVQNDLEISFSLLTKAAMTSNVARRAASHLGNLRSKILRRLAAESSRSARSIVPASAAGMLGSGTDGTGRPLTSSAANNAMSARTGLDALSEAAASSQVTSTLNTSSYDPFAMATSSSMDSVASTAPTMHSSISNKSFTATRPDQPDNESLWPSSSSLSHQPTGHQSSDELQQQQCASALAAYHNMEDLSAILESDNLPPEIANGPPAQWAWMDPLLQATLFWHTDSNGSFSRS